MCNNNCFNITADYNIEYKSNFKKLIIFHCSIKTVFFEILTTKTFLKLLLKQDKQLLDKIYYLLI